jgi:RHS repeat-associated protein
MAASSSLGDRISMTVGSETITYTLDLAAPLVQVLVANEDGTHTAYLYGIARIGEDDGGWQYYLADHLGSVRSLVDGQGSVAGTQAYQPYGVPLSSAGALESVYGFTGEQTDPTGLVYVRARMYAPGLELFLSRDPWAGNAKRPGTLHAWSYVQANPINYFDPSGLQPPPSSIHAMIQIKFMDTHGLGHWVVPEFRVPGGSKTGLALEMIEMVPFCQNPWVPGINGVCASVTAWLEGQPKGTPGWIDIVDRTTAEAFEIKNEKELIQGLAEIDWYISKYNGKILSGEEPPDPSLPMLWLGSNYTWTPEWELIGTNPAAARKGYEGAVIVANMQAPGVITYKSMQKDDYFKRPEPKDVYVWDWDPEVKSVRKRRLDYVYNACPSPSLTDTARDTALIAGGIYALWRIGKVVIGFVVAGPPGAAIGAAIP